MINLPSLPYGYSDLEPYISEETMRLHHRKHHQAYVDGVNKNMEKLKYLYLYDNSREKLEKVCDDLSFNLDGHKNHSIFWEVIAPRSWNKYLPDPNSRLYLDIKTSFGSFSEFKSIFIESASSVKGSGWIGLGYSTDLNELLVYSFLGQDGKKMTNLLPILLIDLWEHSYYLDYKSDRKRYLVEIFDIINWEHCSKVYDSYLAT